MKKLLMGSTVLVALLIQGNNVVNAVSEQIIAQPRTSVTDKKIKTNDQQNNVLTGHYDQETNIITWEIQLNSQKEKFTGDLKLENLIPEGLVLDSDTIEVIKNDDFIQNTGMIKLHKNKLTAVFPAKKYSGSTVLIKYQTKVETEPTEANYLRVSQTFNFGDDQMQEYEQNIKYNREKKDFIIETPHKFVHQDDEKVLATKKSKNNEEHSEDWLKRLAELIANKKEETTPNKGGEKASEQVKDQKQQASPDTTTLSHTPTVKGLTGFDTKTNKVKSKAKKVSRSVKNTLDSDEIEENDTNVSPKSEKHSKHITFTNNKRDTSETKAELPKTGEVAGILLSVLGLFHVIVGCIIRTKFLK